MKVRAPGKLLLLGAYAVLEGGDALVVAVDRFAVADDARTGEASREVRAALGDEPAPVVDTSGMYAGEAKLGLGSSAAVLVATLGVRAARRGEDLARGDVRDALFAAARAAHAKAQGGGSGVDVAASVYGGALGYSMQAGARAVTLPAAFRVVTFWSGSSARTSDLVARVASLKARDLKAHATATGVIREAACEALLRTDVATLVASARATQRALAALGSAADAPIVPPAFAELAVLAEGEGAAFLPSGAGGGDVAVYLGDHDPSAAFSARARALGMRVLDLGMDHAGVRRDDSPAHAERLTARTPKE
jgi:phosphomevalonate kinase